MSWQWLLRVIDRHRIVYGVTGALLIAVLLTTISMALYVSSGASRLDLSRPGYEGARGEIGSGSVNDNFSATGSMNSSVADDFQSRFSKHRQNLQKLDTYGTNALDDDELQIAPKQPNE